MRNTILAGAALALVIAAYAQPTPVAFANGRGIAQNAEGRRAEFGFEAAKFEGSTGPVVRGNFNFAIPGPNNTRMVGVRCRVERLTRNGDLAEFGGPGVLVRRTANGNFEEVRGIVQVRVEDKKARNNDDPAAPKDTFAVRVMGPNSTVAFAWGQASNTAGWAQVVRGDIAVGPRNNP